MANQTDKFLNALTENTCKGVFADFLCGTPEDKKSILADLGIEFKIENANSANQEKTLTNYDEWFKRQSLEVLWAIELALIDKLNNQSLMERYVITQKKYLYLIGNNSSKGDLDFLFPELAASVGNSSTTTSTTSVVNIDSHNSTDANSQQSVPEDQQTTATDDNAVQASSNTSPAPVTKQNDYADSSADDVNVNNIESLRSKTKNLTRQIQRLHYCKYLRLKNFADSKENILWPLYVLLVSAASAVIVCNYCNCLDFNNQPALLLLATILAGMIGACMSMLQRTENAAKSPINYADNILDALEIKVSLSFWYILSMILSGAVFATLLYIMANAGVIKVGEFFPDLTTPTGKNVYLVLIWGFLSGWAERLVPDVLDKIAEKSKAQQL